MSSTAFRAAGQSFAINCFRSVRFNRLRTSCFIIVEIFQSAEKSLTSSAAPLQLRRSERKLCSKRYQCCAVLPTGPGMPKISTITGTTRSASSSLTVLLRICLVRQVVGKTGGWLSYTVLTSFPYPSITETMAKANCSVVAVVWTNLCFWELSLLTLVCR